MSLFRTIPGACAAILIASAVPAFAQTTPTEPTEPEVTVPETTVPETTVPETTVPEVTVPETTEPVETEPETTEAPTTEPEAPATAETAPAATPEAPEIITEQFGDWEKRCTADRSRCFIYQLARDEGGNPVAEVTIVALPDEDEAEGGATIVTPLGTLLTAGLVLQIDSGQARKYEFGWCTASGCFARFGLEPGYVANFKRGNRAIMQLSSVSAPERPITLNVSLTGFTNAFNALKEEL